MKNVACALSLILISLAFTAVADEATEIASKAGQSVATLVAFGPKYQILRTGSAFVIEKNIMVTNYHVIEGARVCYAIFGNGKIIKVGGVKAGDKEKVKWPRLSRQKMGLFKVDYGSSFQGYSGG